MGYSLNRAELIGNLGQDPDFRTTPSGTPVCKLRIATTDKFKNRNGEWQERTEWHSVTLWAKLGEIANQYLQKGSKVFIEGRISTNTYEKDGITRYFTEIVAQNMIMLSPKSGGGGESYSSGSSYSQQPQQSEPQEKKWEKDLPKDDEDEDDIPF